MRPELEQHNERVFTSLDSIGRLLVTDEYVSLTSVCFNSRGLRTWRLITKFLTQMVSYSFIQGLFKAMHIVIQGFVGSWRYRTPLEFLSEEHDNSSTSVQLARNSCERNVLILYRRDTCNEGFLLYFEYKTKHILSIKVISYSCV